MDVIYGCYVWLIPVVVIGCLTSVVDILDDICGFYQWMMSVDVICECHVWIICVEVMCVFYCG